jgi:hypothetical protein
MRRIFMLFSLLICIFSSSAFAQQRSTLFPEFFSGPISGGVWICEMFFTNQDIYSAPGINIAFYNFDGNPVYVDSNLGNAVSYTFDLDAGATQIIQVNPEAAYVEGYTVMTYPSSGSPVRATVVYRLEDGQGSVLGEFGVPQQEFGSHYSFPVEMNNDPSRRIYTAVAVANPAIFSSSPQTMIFRLIGTDGEIDATATKEMQPGEHFADYLDQASLFQPYFSGLGSYNYVGSLSVSSPFGVGVMAIRQDKNAFGAISTDGGPVLGPFALSSASVGEVEVNDSLGQAQSIAGSAVITGTIGAPGDVDYFKFTGQQGDILSVVCDAQLDGSWLDSVLEISDSSDTLIAANDQNGLSPEGYPLNDSFIQVVLPANGTYYIMLTDYFGDGGSEYTYTLHIKTAAGN